MKKTKHITNNRHGKPFHRFWIYAAALVLLVAALVTYQVTQNARSISYSDFKQYLAKGNIASLEISDEKIHGRLKDAADGLPEKFSTNRVDDPGLVSQLEAIGIRFSGKSDGILPPARSACCFPWESSSLAPGWCSTDTGRPAEDILNIGTEHCQDLVRLRPLSA